MSRIFIFGLICLSFLIGCQSEPKQESSSSSNNNKTDEVREAPSFKNDTLQEFYAIVQDLQSYKMMETLRSMRPNKDVFLALFKDQKNANIAYHYIEQKYSGLEAIRPNTFQPNTKDARIDLISASKQELATTSSKAFRRYHSLAPLLRDDVTLYALQYTGKKGQIEIIREAFVKIDDHWYYLPILHRAF